MSTSPIDLSSTALVFIDLQHGIVNLPLLPRSGEEVVQPAAMTPFSEEAHFFSVRHIPPRIGLVRSLEEVLSACTDSGVHQLVI